MANPWEEKNRLFWKIDPKFTEFNGKLFNEFWSFEDVCKFVQFDNYLFGNDHDRKQILDTMKSDWLSYVNEWNRLENINRTNEAKGFVAITYLFIVIPYEKIDNVGKYFTLFEANNINIAYFYNTNGDYLPFADVEELFDRGPSLPCAYQEWINDKYNRASWWISYMVYEKINGFSPVIDSEPVKLK